MSAITVTAAPPEHNLTGVDFNDRGHFRYAGPPLIDFHSHVMQTRPGDPGVRYQLALIALDGGKANDARRELEALVKESPQFTEAHVSLSMVYYRLKRPEEGKREHDIVQRLTAEAQAKQPGVRPDETKSPEKATKAQTRQPKPKTQPSSTPE